MKKRIIILNIFFFIILASFSSVKAAYANLTSSKTNMNVGETATISVSLKAASWNVHLTGAVTLDESDTSADGENVKKTFSVKFKPTKEGTYKVNMSGDITDGGTNNTKSIPGSITISVKKRESNTSESNTQTSSSSDATLSNLGITPNDFKGFSKDKTTYSVSVPDNVEKISIYAIATDKGATVTGAGAKTLKSGKNTFNIKVTAKDKKTTKTYTLNITRGSGSDEVPKNNATLSNLGIRPKEYDFTGFKPGTTDYKVEVPNKVEKVTIYASKSASEATIEGIGEKTLKVGENKFAIKVTAEDKKTTKTYNLTVTRKEEGDSEENSDEDKTTTSVTGVTNIKIENYELTPEFKPETYEYKVELPSDKENVKVDVETEDDIEAEVVGNEDLKAGENIITILVRDTKNDATTTYQIIANVAETEDSTTTEESENVDASQSNSEIGQVKRAFGKRDLIIAGVIALIALLTIVLLIKRHKSRQDEFYDDDEFENQLEETKSDEISETKNFYNQMKNENLYKDDDISKNINVEMFDEYEKPKRRGRYKGKRFK